MKRLLIALFFALVVSGCSSLNPPDSYYSAQATRAAMAGAAAQQPLLKISGAYSCIGSGCLIEVYDPRSHERLAPIERGTTGADVAVEAIRGTTDLLKFGVGGLVVSRALREVGERNHSLTNSGAGTLSFENDKHATSIEQIDVGESMDTMTTSTATSTESGDSYRDTMTTSTETSTASGDSYSGNASNSGWIDSPSDETHPPTVVNQPPAVIVTQPAPLVVQP